MSIEVRHLYFSFGKRAVLRDISFSADGGDLLCVLGANGVGKSTLFRCMLGLQGNYTGEITLDGEDIHKFSPPRLAKKIAYIPQYHTPAFSYSVFHTVLMGTTTQISTLSSPKKEQEDEATAAMEQLGIAHLRDRNYDCISGGERQLALIARAMVQRAKILIMDEPTANLDYGNQVRVMEQIGRLTKEGYTVILSTHNPEHGLLYATRAMVLREGTVLRLGSPEEVITEDVLKQVYGVNVRIAELEDGGRTLRVCVPVGQRVGTYAPSKEE